MYGIFSGQEVAIFLNLPWAIKRRFPVERFYIRLLGIENEVFYSHLQKYGTNQTIRSNRSNFQILLNCIVMNAIFILLDHIDPF